MSQKLTSREKRLLLLCVAALFLVGNLFAFREFNLRHKSLRAQLIELEEEANTNRIMISDAAFWEKRSRWLDEQMPFTSSSGRAQGQLLEFLQTTALDHELTVSNQTLAEPMALDHANEVAVTIRVRGDHEKLLRWLMQLQSPERFHAIKHLDLELDTRAREATPQAQCNLTVARWFNPKAPPTQAPIVPSPSATSPQPTPPQGEEDDEEEPVNPLELGSPMGGL